MTIRKIGSTLLAAVLILGTLIVCGGATPPAAAAGESPAPEGPPPDRSFGALSLLNMTEEEYKSIIYVRGLIGKQLGAVTPAEAFPDVLPEDIPDAPPSVSPDTKIVYYDTLDALLMALNAGDIDDLHISLRRD